MARLVIAAQTTPGAYIALQPAAHSRDLTETAGQVGDGNYATLVEGKTVILAHNTDSGAQTVNITSVADPTLLRPGDITAYSIDAGKIALFGPFKGTGWTHGGQIWFDPSSALVKFIVLTLP